MAVLETVVDSSVVVKWFLPEPFRPEAVRLLRAYQEQRIRLIAPSLLMSEVCNVFAKRLRRGEVSAASVHEAYRLLKINAPAAPDDAGLMDDALPLAMKGGQAVYDCLYLALAIRRGCDMVTADQRFHAAMAPMFPMLLRL